MVLVFVLQLMQLRSNGGLALHCLHQLRAGQLIPRRCDQSGLCIMLPDQRNGGIQLLLSNGIGAGQNDGGCGFDLVVVELTKVLHIYLHLTGIGNGNRMTQHHIFIGHFLNGSDHIRQLAYTGGLDNDPIGVIFGDDLGQRLAKIAHQAAANAAGVHFRNVDAGVLQETAVDADLAKFIFDQHQFFALVGFLDHLFDQRGLAGTKEAGININFCHSHYLLWVGFFSYLIL